MFDDVSQSILSVFKVVMIEGWFTTFYKLRMSGSGYSTIFYFLTIIVICDFLLSHLVIAALV